MKVIDVDTHLIEPASVWDYLSESEQEHKPSILEKVTGSRIKTHFSGPNTRKFWVINDDIYGMHDAEAIAAASKGELSVGAITLDDIDARLADMDKQKVDVQVVFSSLFLNLRISDSKAELALTRAFNRWIMERFKRSSGRLLWVMVPSLKNPEETVKDMKWARDNGAV
jgi:hypothetical protein